MKRVSASNVPYKEWFSLTEKGARILLIWHFMGYGCKENFDVGYQLDSNFYELDNMPPQEFPLHELL